MTDHNNKNSHGETGGNEKSAEEQRKEHSGDPGRTPGSAEGDEKTVDKALENQGGGEQSK